MLHRIGHRCRSLICLPFTPLNPSILILTKSSSSLISAQALEVESLTTSSTTNGPLPSSSILSLFKLLGGYAVKFLGVEHRFRTLVSGLNSRQVDEIIEYLRIEDPNSAVDFFELLKTEYGFRHSRVSQFVIAHLLASQQRLKLLRSNLLQMLQEEGSASGPLLCELLSVDFKGWEANAIVWDMLAFAYSRSEMVHDALFVIAKMKDLNVQASILTYNSLLYNLRHSDIMWDVYNDIKDSGVHESKQTNSILVDGLCMQSLMQEAVTLLRGKDIKESSPHVASFNTVMSSFSKMGFIDIAQSIFCLMLKFGVHPDTYSYNILINGLCLAGSIEDALKLTNDMDKHGVTPDEVTYNTLSKGFRVLGMISGASKMIQQMLTKGLNPDSVTYTLLICGNCQEGKVEESLDLRDEMISRGYQLNYISYSVLVSSLCKIGRVDEALCLLSEMEIAGLKPDGVMYSIIIHGLCKKGDIQRAIQLYVEMCTKRIFPSIFTHRAVLLGLCGNGPLSEDADKLFSYLREHNFGLKKAAYTTLIQAHCVKGDAHQAMTLFSEMVKMGFQVTIRDYSAVINRLCKRCLTNEAKVFFTMMLSNGVSPDFGIYTVMMYALRLVGDLHSMHVLLPNMVKCGLDAC